VILFYFGSTKILKRVKEVAMELIREEKLIEEFDRFLENRKACASEFSSYTELKLFTDIQYLKILESQLDECKKINSKNIRNCEHSLTKFVSQSYTILTPAYLKRKQKQVLDTLEKIQQIIADYLDNVSQYVGFENINCWFAWWDEYMQSLTDEEYVYIAECKKQSQEPVKIHPNKSLQQFALEQQNTSKKQSKPTKQIQKVITPEIA